MHCCRKHMTAGKQQPMNEHLPTLLIVYLLLAHDKGALFHLDEALTSGNDEQSIEIEEWESCSIDPLDLISG